MAEESAGGGTNPLTKKLGPLPMWVWMAIIFLGVVIWQYSRGKVSTTDPQTGLKGGTAADQQARAAQLASVSAGGAQTPPTIIQNYPAPTTIAFPVRGSAFGFNGAPTWPIGSWHKGRHGGPGPDGPGHHPHGRGWHGGEHHGPGPHPGGPHHQGHGGPEHGGHHGGRPDHDHGGGPEHQGHHGGGHGGGGRPEHDHHGEEHDGGGGRGGHGGGRGGGRH